LAPIVPEKNKSEKVHMDGTKEKNEERHIIQSRDPKKSSEVARNQKQGHGNYKELTEKDLFDEFRFTHVTSEEIEIDHDTNGEKVKLEKPIVRRFKTKTGSCCCKSDTDVSMEGVVYNPNIRSYADEIKFHFKMDTNGRSDKFKSLAVITSFGCVPANDPRPDLMVWQALSIYRYFPDGELKQTDFDTKENAAYLENEMYKTPGSKSQNHYRHFITNTEKNPKIPTHFRFPKPEEKSSKIELFGKVKIGRRNGLGTFYTSNSVFKTVYALKFIPVFKGSDSNGAKVAKGKVGIHLTVPISVKAKDEPTAADIRTLTIMYQGKDRENTLNKSKLGKMKNMVVPL
jgi:hypothetical protein